MNDFIERVTKSKNKDELLKNMKIMFEVSCITFDTGFKIYSLINKGHVYKCKMHVLHEIMRDMLNSENPDFNLIDYLLKLMDIETEENRKKGAKGND